MDHLGSLNLCCKQLLGFAYLMSCILCVTHFIGCLFHLNLNKVSIGSQEFKTDFSLVMPVGECPGYVQDLC